MLTFETSILGLHFIWRTCRAGIKNNNVSGTTLSIKNYLCTLCPSRKNRITPKLWEHKWAIIWRTCHQLFASLPLMWWMEISQIKNQINQYQRVQNFRNTKQGLYGLCKWGQCLKEELHHFEGTQWGTCTGRNFPVIYQYIHHLVHVQSFVQSRD